MRTQRFPTHSWPKSQGCSFLKADRNFDLVSPAELEYRATGIMRDLWADIEEPRHMVVVVGGAVAGSEAAAFFAKAGFLPVVVEQNPKPYGKIEDGLPRWHRKLRDAEYAKIDANLMHPNIAFLPSTRFGKDLGLEQIFQEWNASAVVLANGAWRDRSLAVEGVDAFINKGLVYQNSFVYWFNHYPEKNYQGPHYEVPEGSIVVGGGLASIDVSKIINFELYGCALRRRGIDVDIEEFEHKGIPKVLAQHGLSVEELNIVGARLFYRRRKEDMPLATLPEGSSDKIKAKIQEARARIMDKVSEKYLVCFEGQKMPVAPLTEGNRLVGLRFIETELRDGRVVPKPEHVMDVPASLVISSIGSIPEPLPGIPSKGELFSWKDWETGELEGIADVFGLGNVLTGKGNIKDSRLNAKTISEGIFARYLGSDSDAHVKAAMQDRSEPIRDSAAAIAEQVRPKDKASISHIQTVAKNIKKRWDALGYSGDYQAWIQSYKSKT